VIDRLVAVEPTGSRRTASTCQTRIPFSATKSARRKRYTRIRLRRTPVTGGGDLSFRIWSVPVLVLAAAALLGFSPANAAAATVLHVPQDYPTIQPAIDAAASGDTVLVAAGTYNQTIDFESKAITVASESGASSTIINGDGVGVVVTMNANAGETPVLRGFTVQNGGPYGFTDGAIDTSGGPALIENNTITANRFCDDGAVSAAFSAATIRNNVISNNSQACSGGVGGAGVAIRGAGTVQLLNNAITGNTHTSAAGGVGLFAAGTPTISGNVIQDNVGWQGGGMSLFNSSDATITNNIIDGNQGAQGGGIYWTVPYGDRGPLVVNNTIAANQANTGLAVYAGGFDDQTSLVNNILVGNGAGSVVQCDGTYDPTPPIIQFNDVYNSGTGPAYGGTCIGETGVNGNISAEPLFVDGANGNFHIQRGSPAVDAGTNSGAPATDIEDDPRPLDGNGDGIAIVDMGADELVPSGDTTPPTITCSASPSVLWPPNHVLRAVTVAISASDDSGSVAVTLLSVTSSQPDSGLDPQDVPNDIQGWAIGTDDRSGSLRAERFEETRIYTLTYEAADPSGNTATCQTTPSVPLKQR
jgi:Right handed beta helix region